MTESNPVPPVDPVPPVAPVQNPVLGAVEQNSDAKNMAMLCHLLGIFTWFVGPLVIWLVKKDTSPFVDDQGKQALNFQITLAIGYIVSLVLTLVCIGYLLLLAVFALNVTFSIIGAVKAGKGIAYRYPVAIPFLK